VRRAHWHTFRAGPRLDAQGQPIPAELRRSDLRWLPPIPVALDPLTDPASLPAVVHTVADAPPGTRLRVRVSDGAVTAVSEGSQ